MLHLFDIATVMQQFSCAIFLFAGEWRDAGIHEGGILRERRGEGFRGRDWGSGKYCLMIKSCESLLIIYQFYSDPSSRLRHVLKGQEESMERGQ